MEYSTSSHSARALPSAATPAALPCHRCGVIDTPAIGPGNGPHAFRSQCAHCGAFVQWVSQYSPAERQARRDQARQQAMAQKPPSQAQLRYLAALDDDEPQPTTMAAASSRIDALRRGEVVP